MSSLDNPPPYYEPLRPAPPSYTEATEEAPPYVPYAVHGNYTFCRGTDEPLSEEVSQLICPYCNVLIETEIKKRPGKAAYLAGLLLALIGCTFGCCIIPCCSEPCMDSHHRCPNCKGYIGKYTKKLDEIKDHMFE